MYSGATDCDRLLESAWMMIDGGVEVRPIRLGTEQRLVGKREPGPTPGSRSGRRGRCPASCPMSYVHASLTRQTGALQVFEGSPPVRLSRRRSLSAYRTASKAPTLTHWSCSQSRSRCVVQRRASTPLLRASLPWRQLAVSPWTIRLWLGTILQVGVVGLLLSYLIAFPAATVQICV